MGGVATSFTFTYAVSLCVRFLLLSVATTSTPVAGDFAVSMPSDVMDTLPVSLRLNVACPAPGSGWPCALIALAVSWMVLFGAVVDSAMARLSGKVVRRAKFEVADEIATAEEAQRKAKQEARKQLREARHAKHQADVDAKIAELKSKLHIDRKHATTAS